jgi:hypothetical protein
MSPPPVLVVLWLRLSRPPTGIPRIRQRRLGETAICYFGGPANSRSPVALRPSLAEGVPFRLLCSIKFELGDLPPIGPLAPYGKDSQRDAPSPPCSA